MCALKRSQLLHREMAEAGQARVYSKALVEENGEDELKAG